MKYYYTNSIKVEWMRQEFQMKFQYRGALRVDIMEPWDGGGCIVFEGAFKDSINTFPVSLLNKAYIHPDCHEMLKPQIGDTIRDGCNVAIIGSNHHESRDMGDYITLPEANKNWQGAEIIQRNGKAWFMPEEEK